ncbi:MAG: preprotein translocase subunit SecE [Aquificae bacterium]|nr:preprotein translocase subunit SecE [Aquificota bacterium]
MGKLIEFLQGVKEELKKVTWPSRELVIKATISVIIFSLVVGAYLWVLDLAFTRLVTFILSLRGSL